MDKLYEEGVMGQTAAETDDGEEGSGLHERRKRKVYIKKRRRKVGNEPGAKPSRQRRHHSVGVAGEEEDVGQLLVLPGRQKLKKVAPQRPSEGSRRVRRKSIRTPASSEETLKDDDGGDDDVEEVQGKALTMAEKLTRAGLGLVVSLTRAGLGLVVSL